MNPCEYSAAILKRQRFQDKHHVRSIKIFLRRNVKTMAFETSPKTPEDMSGWAKYYSFNIGTINKRVNIIHIHANLRIAVLIK